MQTENRLKAMITSFENEQLKERRGEEDEDEDEDEDEAADEDEEGGGGNGRRNKREKLLLLPHAGPPSSGRGQGRAGKPA